jgi:glycosyltransferase involved in cell wall biosynthesis
MIDISVLLPVRDWDLTRVDMCMRSLKVPNDYEVEIVLVDYGSSDPEGIRNLALAHGCTFQRVEAVEWSRSKAMNTAAQLSSGRHLLFADADLVFAPAVLPSTVQKLDGNPNAVLVFQVRDLPATIKPEELLDEPDFDYLESQAVWRPQWGMGIQAHTRRAFEMIRGFDDRMTIYGGEDNDLAKRARGNGFRLEWANSPAFGLYHVWHPSSRQAADSDPATKTALEKNTEIAKNDTSTIRNLASWRSEIPLVSVVIATLNRAEYLADSINSVLDQTFQDFEIVIMDDGSTDNTREVVQSLNDGRITYIRQENSGIPALRNKALEFSRGRYTAIHDDDDIMLPWSLESRLRAIQPGLVGSYGGAFDFDNESGAMQLFAGRQAELSSIAEGGRVFYHATVLIETEALRSVRYDECFPSGSDYNLALRLMKVGFRFGHCGDVVLLRRLHGQQVSVTNQGVQHGASYASTFSQKATWSPIGRRRSRDRSKELGPWQYDEELTSHSRVVPYLPNHLVRRSALMRCTGDQALPDGAIVGRIVEPGRATPVTFVNEVPASQLSLSHDEDERLFRVHTERREEDHSLLQTFQHLLREASGHRLVVTINPHLFDQGFKVVTLEDLAELQKTLDWTDVCCYFVLPPADVTERQILDELAGVCVRSAIGAG